MNSRAVSLPNLAADRQRNTALSLSEGFAGAGRHATLNSTALNLARRPAAGEPYSGDDGSIPSRLSAVLPLYYRTRQLVLSAEKAGKRAPQRLMAELKAQEKQVADELRPLHPLLFQRFDNMQMDRLLRAMPMLKLSAGRWIFGDEELAHPWPETGGDRAFLLLYGRVSLFGDPRGGAGERNEIRRGAIFGLKRFKLVDEGLMDHVAGSAYCEEPCVVGCLTTKVLQTAFADRALGNKRIETLTGQIPVFRKVVQDDRPADQAAPRPPDPKKGGGDAHEHNNAVQTALHAMSKVSAPVHVRPGDPVWMEEPLDETVLIVARGAIEVRCDVTLEERLDKIPPKKSLVKVYVDKAEKLAGDSWMDKLDPYAICKLGDYKRFQTPVLWNVGPNPKWEYNGVLKYSGEQLMEITVMDHDKYSADDLCGTGTLDISNLPDGWTGTVALTRPKQGMFGSDDVQEEPAGKVFVRINWVYEKANAFTKVAKSKMWKNQVLFTVKEREVWGYEQIMLDHQFRKILENASLQTNYKLTLGEFSIFGAEARGAQENVTCWKLSKQRFLDFIRGTGRDKSFLQTSRVTALEKQTTVHHFLARLIKKWEQEELATFLKSANFMNHEEEEEGMDASLFRSAYRGVKAQFTVRNALNLHGGSMFDKLDPYVKLRFSGSKSEFKSSVLQDSGSDPSWDCDGTLVYNGETALEITVYNYDRHSQHDVIGTGKLQVEQFCRGFEGMIPLTLPGNKKKKSSKQMMIIIGIIWGQPRMAQTSIKDVGDSTAGMSRTY